MEKPLEEILHDCKICLKQTTHIYVGFQKGIEGDKDFPGFALYNCKICKDTIAHNEQKINPYLTPGSGVKQQNRGEDDETM